MDECDYRTINKIPCTGNDTHGYCAKYSACWPMDKTVESKELSK